MVFENVTNVVFIDMCNFNLNPIELLNEVSMFCSILFHQHKVIMFSNIKQLNCIVFGKTKLSLKKMLQNYLLCGVFAYTMFLTDT